MHTQVVLFDGFDPLDAIAPYEVLYAGGSATDGAVTVELVTAEGQVGPRVAHAVEELLSHERRCTVWRAQGPTATTL
jgi:putative intracellular protease/amidase